MNEFLSTHETLLAMVNALMTKLKKCVPAMKLRKYTLLAPKIRNDTRWSSSFTMISRYLEIKEFIRLVAEDYSDWLLPRRKDDEAIEALHSILKDLESVTKELQKETVTLAQVRTIFDQAILEHPSTFERLQSNAKIVYSKLFESAYIKILNKEATMSNEERNAVSHLKMVKRNMLLKLSHQERT